VRKRLSSAILITLVLAAFFGEMAVPVGVASKSPLSHDLVSVTTNTHQWAQTYGGTGNDVANSVVQTSDGGYIVAGYTNSFGGVSSYDAWIVKLNATGGIVWQKTYGGKNSEIAHSIQQTSDGGYIVAGSTTSFGAGGVDAWIFRLNSTGGIIWQKTYGGTGTPDLANSIQQTSDGGFIVAGTTTPFGNSSDLWVLKPNSNGGVSWQKTFGGAADDYGSSVRQTPDGGYAVAGYTYSFGAGLSDAWVLKLRANGGLQWQRTYGGSNYDFASSIASTTSGTLVVAGYTSSFGAGSEDGWVLNVNATNGRLIWQKTYGGSGDDQFRSIEQTSDGGYIVAGETNSFGAGEADVWLLKLGSNGNTVWQSTYGGAVADIAYAAEQTSDGGFVVAGSTYSFGDKGGHTDVWILKTKGVGSISGCSPEGVSNATATRSSAKAMSTVLTAGTISPTVKSSHAIVSDTNANLSTTCSG
jgi:uncharacterized delta-60 repeat protein